MASNASIREECRVKDSEKGKPVKHAVTIKITVLTTSSFILLQDQSPDLLVSKPD